LVDERGELTSSRFDKNYTSGKIGRRLTRMNLRKEREGKEGRRIYRINKQELEKLKIKFGMADTSDTTDAFLERIYTPINEGEEKTIFKIEEKAENNQVLERDSKKDIEKTIGMPSKKVSEVSVVSAEYGICELCGSDKEVFLIKVEQLNNKKIAICQNCLKEMKKDQYQIITKLRKIRNDEITNEGNERSEDFLIFSNKIRKEKFGNIEMYICNFCKKLKEFKNCDDCDECKYEEQKCNFRTITLSDMENHLKTHLEKGENNE
jgi:ribosomal protein L37AE/L43A